MIPVRGRVPSQWGEQTASHITERLQAIERELSGGRQVFHAPAGPTFGSGSGTVQSSGAGSTGGTVGGGVVDHGLLIGLSDNDHPQYQLQGDSVEASPHVHGEHDVLGLESRFIQRGEQVTPEPHEHSLFELRDVDERVVLRGEQVTPEPHSHVAADVADLPQSEGAQAHAHTLADVADFGIWEMMLWQEVIGG